MYCSLIDSFSSMYISVRVSEAIVTRLNRDLAVTIMQEKNNNKILSKPVTNVVTKVTA